MSNSQLVQIEPIRTLGGSSITSSYAAVGAALAEPARILVFTNNTDGDVFFSYDGTSNYIFVPKSGFKLFDFCTNRFNRDQFWVFAEGTQWFVKQSSSTSTGAVYIEAFYGITPNPLEPSGL